MAADSCKQSPLSRAIKEQEQHLGVHWFERTTRCTNLTWVGKVFLDEALRIFACIDQAKASVKTAATGYHGRLRHEGPEHLLTFPPTHSGKGAIQHGVPGGHVKRAGNPPPLGSGRQCGAPSKPTRPLRPAAGHARRRPVAQGL